MKQTFQSRGKGYGEIVRGARKMLELAVNIDDETGDAILTSDDIDTVLSQVDDPGHFEEPMAQALLAMILESDTTIKMRRIPAVHLEQDDGDG